MTGNEAKKEPPEWLRRLGGLMQPQFVGAAHALTAAICATWERFQVPLKHFFLQQDQVQAMGCPWTAVQKYPDAGVEGRVARERGPAPRPLEVGLPMNRGLMGLTPRICASLLAQSFSNC